MADPISIPASILSIAAVSAHSIRAVLNDLDSIKDAPKTLHALRNRLASLERALESLQTIADEQWGLVNERLLYDSRIAINSCKKTCNEVRAILSRWAQQSGCRKDKDFITPWERFVIGFIKQRQIKSINKELDRELSAINTVFSTATF
ncbi:hypothetical protein VTJ83DRAFT_1368 [Remersonia thermophila]|uniref:Azaphilone pigments biosynthesis cluster protein L N-terminal domain-containing protein n=1 Tax=Remersonia thermophila TaxID=72144 RepID=A0ABR4DQY1_9PEZI